MTPNPPSPTNFKDLNNQAFDFIIVGAGTSGCLLAARLATTSPTLRILLLEAGGEVQLEDLIPGYTKPRFGSQDGNWIYETVNQMGLNGRTVPYPRGRGMGGCSGNNFMAWVRGPRDDYDDWAKMVGDDWWKWENVLRYMKRLEDFRPTIPQGKEHYAIPTPGYHSTGGTFAVGYGSQWQPLIEYCMQAGQEAGHAINLDNNDGHPLGISIAQFNVDNGARVTSATAFLNTNSMSKLTNLVVMTNVIASRLISKGTHITGVELLPTIKDESSLDIPITVHANREVILTAGCFQTPQLLLLSGIGPKHHLDSLGIQIVKDLPAVGQNLQDHSAFACEFIINPSIAGHNQLLNDTKALAAAVDEYKQSNSGPLAMFGASASIIFPKLPKVLKSKEFASLPTTTKTFLQAPTRPSTEIWLHSGPLFYTGPCPPDASVLVIEGLCQNNLSRGSLGLRSSNPRDLPLINPNYLSHPFDTRIAVETLREIVKLAKTPTLSSIIESILLGPRAVYDSKSLAGIDGEDDKTLEDFVKETLTQGFHSMSTCVMGLAADPNRVVGIDLKVDGLTGLRIADMSVCPILTSNHTQINAYLIGERCAQLVLEEMLALSGSLSKL